MPEKVLFVTVMELESVKTEFLSLPLSNAISSSSESFVKTVFSSLIISLVSSVMMISSFVFKFNVSPLSMAISSLMLRSSVLSI